MSSSRSYQCLSCRIRSTITDASKNFRRQFHASPSQQARNRPRRHANITAKDMGIAESRQPEVDSLAAHLRPYTEREKKLLALKYTPQQMKAIEEGEKAIDPKEMLQQGRFRTDPMRIDYIDDFATVRPVVDHPSSDLQRELNAPLQPGEQPISDAMQHGRGAAQQKRPQQQQEESEDPQQLRLRQQTGLTKEQIRRLRTKQLVQHRVVNQTRMGKISSVYCLTIAGDGDGMLGIGEGKAAEFEDASKQAVRNAIKGMKPIPRYEERTIFGEVQGKVGASVVQLSARAPGFGNRCQHLIFELARAAGITDLAARTPRSRNKMNVVKAAFQALTNQRLPEDIARARGRKMVDVRGVYYGGLVH